MTITSPDFTPVQIPSNLINYRPVTDITPFTFRAGITYQLLLESLRKYATEYLPQYLAQEFGDSQEAWQENLDQLVEAVNTALTAQTSNINAELASTLASIVAGSNSNLNDGNILAALELAGSTSLAYLDNRYQLKSSSFGFYVVQGTGIDPTGATDSTAGLNTFFAALPVGASAIVPPNALFVCSGTVTLPKRIHFSGSGEIRWNTGVAGSPMLHVLADGTNVDGLYMTNPNHLANKTGAKGSGMYITANNVRVNSCRIVGAQQPIWVDANGEWVNTIITDNFCLDVPGSGDGQANSGANGEDRGDGIYTMGALAVICNNVVSALAGTDARIGIGSENLASYEAVVQPHSDAMVAISNNVVTGKFRRGITSEGVASCPIIGNTVSDATWYGINLVNTAHGNIIADNTIEISRATADDQGSAWSPVRSGINVYDGPADAIIRGNTIRVTGTGGAVAGISTVVGAGGQTTDLVIEGNTIDGIPIGTSVNLLGTGILVNNGALRPHIRNNVIKGFSITGVMLAGTCNDPEVVGNHIIGPNTAAGIVTNGTGSTDGVIDNNLIEGVGAGINAFFRTGLMSVNNNKFKNVGSGIDFYGFTAPMVVSCSLNAFFNVTTHVNNAPTGANITYTSVGNN